MAFRQPAYVVTVNGQDVTSRFAPLLKSIDVSDRDGLASDTCSMTLADPDGSVALPEAGARVEVDLGHADTGVGRVFAGFVDEVRSRGSKGGGRELQISAKGVDTRGNAKAQQGKHKDDAAFGDVAQEWAAAAGLNGARVSEALASIQRPYWAMQNESFIAWGQRVARQIGATFKIQDNTAVFVETNGGTSAGGSELPAITATVGDNLITWDIAPVVGRPRYAKAKVSFYDKKTARYVEKEVEVEGGEGATAENTFRFTAPDEAQAEQQANTEKVRSERNGGRGSVEIIGDPTARPEAICNVVGARPGIDGAYRIEGVTHRLSKSGGYITSLELKQPQGSAGTDDRKPTAANAGGSGSGGQAPFLEAGENLDAGNLA